MTALLGVTGLALCVGMMGYAFERGLVVADGAFDFYRLTHPLTAFPYMDQFFWGQIVSVAHLNYSGVRWTAMILVLLTGLALGVSCLNSMRPIGQTAPDARLIWIFALSLCALGAFFGGSITRPNLNYTYSLVIGYYIFVAAMIASRSARGPWYALLLITMGAALALIFMARAPSAILALIYYAAYCWYFGTGQRFTKFLMSLLLISTIAALLILMAIYFGYDILNQFRLLGVAFASDHGIIDLIGPNFKSTILIASVALAGAAAYFSLVNVVGTDERGLLGCFVIGATTLAVLAIVCGMAAIGEFSDLLSSQNPLYVNITPRRILGPAIHAGAICLLLLLALPFLSAKFTFLQKWVRPGNDSRTASTLQFSLFLYAMSILPVAGTNNVLWSQSSVSIVPVFLVEALLVSDLLRRTQFAHWMVPVLAGLTGILVLAGLYSGLLAQPDFENGSTWHQTAVLDHPVFLRGLLVVPPIKKFQHDLEMRLAAQGYDATRDTLVTDSSDIGVIPLLGATALGGGYLVARPEKYQLWNCTVAGLGLRGAPRRLYGIDISRFTRDFVSCLPGYSQGRSMRVDDTVTITVFNGRE